MKLEWPVALLPVKHFVNKHHAVLFISIIALLLALAVYILYETSNTTVSNDNPISSIGQFDKVTIEKIKNLRDSNTGNDKINLPCPRQSVFTDKNTDCIYWFSGQLGSYQSANNGAIPTSSTLCTFVKSYLEGTDCTTVGRFFTDSQGKPYTIQYRYTPKASNEIGYWDSSACSAQSTNGVASSDNTRRYALIAYRANQTPLCVSN